MKFLVTMAILAITATSFLAFAETDCQKHRAREISKPAGVGVVIPECNADGTYKTMQCQGGLAPGVQVCQCWSKTGKMLSIPGKNMKACDCLVKADEVNPMAIGAYKPTCNEDGTYATLQSHGSTGMSWCSSPEGAIITSKNRKITACDCLVKAHKTPAIPGAWKPKCNEDGTYAALQSHGSTGMSWCSNPDGKELTERKRGPVKCT
jgi:hypothetical protein